MYIPAGCTGELKPLDLSANDEYKNFVKNSFIQFYAYEVAKEIDANQPQNDQYKITAFIIKPLHTGWIVEAHEKMSGQP